MKIERQQVGTVDVFMPVGPLVDNDGEKFCKTLVGRLKAANPRVVVAMHEVPYVDSVSLEGLLDATESLTGRGMSLRLANVTPACREILELTGLSGRFRFFETVQDAVRSFL
jgi:anti-anti-sigma factor